MTAQERCNLTAPKSDLESDLVPNPVTTLLNLKVTTTAIPHQHYWKSPGYIVECAWSETGFQTAVGS